jgi:acyl carrier protein
MNPQRAKMLAGIRTFLAEERELDPDGIHEHTEFRELGLDSLDLAEMAMEWEDEYGVLLDDEQMAAIRTFGDAIDRVLANRKPVALA